MGEEEIAATLLFACRRRGFSVPVVLAAADERIASYRRPNPKGARPWSAGRCSWFARRGASLRQLTRFVELDEPDEATKRRRAACETLLRRMREEATRPGWPLANAFADCQRFHAEAGFPDE